jgi:Asp-tRNA(Asn)/Glu-tRNA(Gln) amidotransferase A subunit family amidase
VQDLLWQLQQIFAWWLWVLNRWFCVPSAVSGIVLKPTIGLVSRSNYSHIPRYGWTNGKTVKDAAILLGILAGIDSKDPVTNESKGKAQADYTKFLDAKAALQGKRIGVEKTRAKISSCMNCKKQD